MDSAFLPFKKVFGTFLANRRARGLKTNSIPPMRRIRLKLFDESFKNGKYLCVHFDQGNVDVLTRMLSFLARREILRLFRVF